MNRENLQRMADYIRTIPQKYFAMEVFHMSKNHEEEKNPECQTVGCVIGHCVVLDTKPIPLVMDQFGHPAGYDYVTWSTQFTGISASSGWRIGLSFYAPGWTFLFGAAWSNVDNTPTGAADRIEYYLKNGLPDRWFDQITGGAPITYQKNTSS